MVPVWALAARCTLGTMQPPNPAEQARLVRRLVELRAEHRGLDAEVSRLQADRAADDLVVKRLKKRRLQLRDCIERIESALIPDEPA